VAGRPSAWLSVEVDRTARTVWAPKAAIAHILGANPSWLSSLEVQPDSDGRLDLSVVARRFVAYRENAAHRKGQRTAKQDDDLEELKREQIRQRIRAMELDNDQREGELVEIEALGRVWTRTLSAFRTSLESIPRKLAAQHGASAQVEDAAAELLHKALTDLGSLDVEGVASDAGSPEVADGPDAPAEPDAERMG
jgi:phage terminase Nu1 subunit (DNA packaging protein)